MRFANDGWKNMCELVESLKTRGIIRSSAVYKAMAETDRADFCSQDPYDDCPQTIGYNATISAPHMHAFALEAVQSALDPNKPHRLLDVGSGSGYLCVAFAKLLGSSGKVYGIEHIQELVSLSRNNTEKHHSEFLKNGRIHFICEDGRKGFVPGSPYDFIHVGASSESVPQDLIDQTRTGGIIVIPVGQVTAEQHMRTYKKLSDGTLADISHEPWIVRYVPLTDPRTQMT